MKKRWPVLISLLFPLILAQGASGALLKSVPSRLESPLKKIALLVLDTGNPGPVKVGFHIELAAGWNLYWVNPGDSGLAPNARWTLPPGFKAGPLRHPVPTKSVVDGLVSLKHSGQVLLVCEITPPTTGWPEGPWQAVAVFEWMACRESCITGETSLKAVFPPNHASLSEGRSLLEGFALRFPRPLSESGLASGSVRAEWTGSAWRLEIDLAGPRAAEAGDFFSYPVEGFVVDNSRVACRGGKIVLPLIPFRGPGAPPPSSVGGVLIAAGAGYEISVPVASNSFNHRIMSIASWR